MHPCEQCLQQPEEGIGPLELELGIVLSHHVGAKGTEPTSSVRAASSPNHWGISPAPNLRFLQERIRIYSSISRPYYSKSFILVIKGIKYAFFLKVEEENNDNCQA